MGENPFNKCLIQKKIIWKSKFYGQVLRYVNNWEWKGWELLRPFTPVDSMLGGQVRQGAEAAHQVWLGGHVGVGAEAAHQVWLGWSLTPVQISLGGGRMPIIINWFCRIVNLFINDWEILLVFIIGSGCCKTYFAVSIICSGESGTVGQHLQKNHY